MNAVKASIIATEPSQLLDSGLFISGFELEFQRCNGERYTGRTPMVNDYAAARAFLQGSGENLRLNLLIELPGHVTGASLEALTTPKETFTYATAVMRQHRQSTVLDFNASLARLRGNDSPGVAEALAKVESYIAAALAALPLTSFDEPQLAALLDMSQFQRPAPNGSIYKLSDAMMPAVEIKRDGTVEGGEIILAKPLPTRKALDVARELFKENNFIVDEGCSFHIHLSVPGLEHRYGQALQWELMLYVLSQYERVPEGVRSRWARNMEYFRPILQIDKYSFVHYHGHYRTWEFRCFGNVDCIEDAEACYQLAVEAMQHAYKVQARQTDSLSPSIFDCGSQRRVYDSIVHQLARQSFSVEELNSLIAQSSAA